MVFAKAVNSGGGGSDRLCANVALMRELLIKEDDASIVVKPPHKVVPPYDNDDQQEESQRRSISKRVKRAMLAFAHASSSARRQATSHSSRSPDLMCTKQFLQQIVKQACVEATLWHVTIPQVLRRAMHSQPLDIDDDVALHNDTSSQISLDQAQFFVAMYDGRGQVVLQDKAGANGRVIGRNLHQRHHTAQIYANNDVRKSNALYVPTSRRGERCSEVRGAVRRLWKCRHRHIVALAEFGE
ncbi:hypothetical protein DYB31_010343 [Aphanomyces astaci]|uniref:Uncharacterized protein n=1 Tax=Aphanomyces astaci TaxID=112090 RepID=A0A397FFH2_APHAT|nr:hypothetical protein DYB31_010343 [Aphanomyces astaci]